MSIKWKKLSRPRPWRPTEEGQEIVGVYLGYTVRDGQWGIYQVALIAVEQPDGVRVPFTVTGTSLIQILDGACVAFGAYVRIIYKGVRLLGGERHMKLYEVFQGEGMLSKEEIAEYSKWVDAEKDKEAS